MKQRYEIDIKVYEHNELILCPFILPKRLFAGETLKLGYHTFEATWSDEDMHDFQVWVKRNEFTLKIIGFSLLEGPLPAPIHPK